MMKRRFASHNVATIGELLDAARESGVRLIACQMTMEVFGYEERSSSTASSSAAPPRSCPRRGAAT